MSLSYGYYYYNVSGYHHVVEWVLTISPNNLLRFIISVWGWQLLLRHFPPLARPVWEPSSWWHQDAEINSCCICISSSFPAHFHPPSLLTHLSSSFFFFSCVSHSFFPSFSSPMYLSLSLPSSSSFFLYFSLHALFFQRRARRPGTVFSVHLRSWWRRSSRLPAYGRVRTTAEGSSSPMKTQEVEPVVATAPSSRQHTHAQTHPHSRVQT